MQVIAVIGFLIFIKNREIFIFSICFCIGFTILAVGEMPAHNHNGNTNNVNISGGFNLDGTEQGSSTGAWGSFSLGGTFTPGKGHGSSGGGSNAGRTINFNNSHSHNITINSTGSGQKHNNMQPYISVYMWKRIA